MPVMDARVSRHSQAKAPRHALKAAAYSATRRVVEQGNLLIKAAQAGAGGGQSARKRMNVAMKLGLCSRESRRGGGGGDCGMLARQV